MPRPYPASQKIRRPLLTTERAEFSELRTAKHIAALIGREPRTVRGMARRYGLPMARERAPRSR